VKCNICGRERYCPFTGPPRKSNEVCKRDDSDTDAEECARHGRSGEAAATERWARADERARIVAAIREEAAKVNRGIMGKPLDAASFALNLAHAIEDGES
jgi:hypothetical protein